MIVRRGTLAALAVTAALSATATPAATSPHWTPRTMDKALRNPSVTLVGVVTNSFKPAVIARETVTVNSASCRGLGSRTRKRYGQFRCRLTYTLKQESPSGPFTGSYWTVPWKKTIVCVTNVSRGTCPPPVPAHPLPGDPRNCSVTKSDPLNGPFSCLTGAAQLAAVRDNRFTT